MVLVGVGLSLVFWGVEARGPQWWKSRWPWFSGRPTISGAPTPWHGRHCRHSRQHGTFSWQFLEWSSENSRHNSWQHWLLKMEGPGFLVSPRKDVWWKVVDMVDIGKPHPFCLTGSSTGGFSLFGHKPTSWIGLCLNFDFFRLEMIQNSWCFSCYGMNKTPLRRRL